MGVCRCGYTRQAVSAARDLASDPHSLFAFPDARDLRRRIDYFLANPGERLASAQQNYQNARRMTHQRSAQQLLAIYEHMTVKGEAPPAAREGLSVVD